MASKKSRGTRPKNTHEKQLDRARLVGAAAHNNLAKIRAALKGKPGIVLDAKYLSEFSAVHAQARAAVAAAGVDKGKAKRAFASVQDKRDAIFFALTEIRDDVALAHPERTQAHSEIRQAFGELTPLVRASTESLRAAAARLEQNYEDKLLAEAGRRAGVTPARIKEITALRQDLTATATEGATIRGANIAATARRHVFLRELEARVSFILKVARRVFNAAPETLGEFTGRKPKKKTRPAGAPRRSRKKTAATRGKRRGKNAKGKSGGTADGSGDGAPGPKTAPTPPAKSTGGQASSP